MKTIAYSSPFVPAEWITAHGLRPTRLMPSAAVAAHAGMCPYAAAFAQAGTENGDALVFATGCDQMRRMAERTASEAKRPVFLMNIPATWQSVTAHRMYRSELARLGRFLVQLGGRDPSPQRLTEVMRESDKLRAALRDSRGRLAPSRYSKAIFRFVRDGKPPPVEEPDAMRRGIPIALLGGPLLGNQFEIFDVIERAGGTVVLDGTESGERTLSAPFDQSLMTEDPIGVLSDAYFGSLPDAFRRPNTLLYQWLKRALAERDVCGIILHYYPWCDIWHAEYQRIKEWTAIPVLLLSADADEGIDAHAVSRIESFVEMLK